MMKHISYGQVRQRAYWLYQLPATTHANTHQTLSESTNNQLVLKTSTQEKRKRSRLHSRCCARAVCAYMLPSRQGKHAVQQGKRTRFLGELFVRLYSAYTQSGHWNPCRLSLTCLHWRHIYFPESQANTITLACPAGDELQGECRHPAAPRKKGVQALPVFSPRSTWKQR
jgi:hypothetical protein